jgi:hypothetical protein
MLLIIDLHELLAILQISGTKYLPESRNPSMGNASAYKLRLTQFA